MVNVGGVLIFTREFDKTVKFYRDVLGLTVKDIDPGAGYRPSVDFQAFDTGEAVLEVFDERVHAGQLGDLKRIQGRVVTAVGVADLKAWLAQCGDSVEMLAPVKDADWGSFVYVVDVNGNPFQVYQARSA